MFLFSPFEIPVLITGLFYGVRHKTKSNKKTTSKKRWFYQTINSVILWIEIYFKPAASRKISALSVASHGNSARPKWP